MHVRLDAADFMYERAGRFGLAADGNGNNQIDPGDYDVWRAHFDETAGSGSGASAGSSSAPVPEPATLVMNLVGLLVMSFRRRAALS
ncbi:MAG: PEP-CTERM sorting domain-containing protein [Pirellulales bacterium]